ncbi:protein phosphatase 2C domain-containing protein [Saccharothrix sp. NRRL B-16314]|uniref:protein phosphatase 2C domain-containing protein n=1 Tax=Saccharothrix sp. NRRL B-16314 TaxID=1463825 RepID=UPI000527753A|nr:protein phosphatase 2C domain-containing protein [Saccharothrix sp. NRRL B-16314]
MVVSSLRVPKHGNTLPECEDAAHVLPVDPGLVLAAVADGASESLLAGEWADLLARSVNDSVLDDECAVRDADRFASALVLAGEAWDGWLASYVARREADGRPIAWYEEPKLDRGPHATVLAARFATEASEASGSSGTSWDAAALGDSCLFHVRDDRLVRAFPLESADAFSNSPGLVNAFNRDRELLARHVRTASGRAEPGDRFFLCTDALAAWFLGAADRGDRPWRELGEFTRSGDLDGFSGWLEGPRAEGVMRNDDVTVVHVDLG